MREEGRLISESVNQSGQRRSGASSDSHQGGLFYFFAIALAATSLVIPHDTVLCCHWMRDLVGEVVLSESNSLAFVSPMMLASTTQQVMGKPRCKGIPVVERVHGSCRKADPSCDILV